MQADEQLRQKRIQILPFAASDRDAEAPFFVVKAGNGLDVARRGMSSLHRRAEGSLLAEVVQIRTVRIDNVLAAEARAGRCIALWIDSEGMAFEVIAGASGVLGGTQMLHVEVETEPCIGADQRLLPDVERTLYDAGFVLLATDKPRSAAQLNALFVRGDALSTRAGAVRWHIAQEQLHWNTKRARRFLSLSLRRFLTIRFHSRPSRERSAS
jgi:hypothetical protein